MFEPTALDGLLLATPVRHEDERGSFCEVFRQSWLERAGVEAKFVQENVACSAHAGVLRGLHFQLGASAQGKLIRVARGAIFDVAVDLRPGSPSFALHAAFELTSDNARLLWIPPGFAHGYLTLQPHTEVVYKTTAYYDLASESGIAFDDPALGIDWPKAGLSLTISVKDRTWPRLEALRAGEAV